MMVFAHCNLSSRNFQELHRLDRFKATWIAMEKYTHGHHKSVVSVHNARTVEDSAAFLLPMLQGHFKLLDVGCGPGSITRGFTKHVKEVVGVDNSEDVIAEARASGDGVDFQVARVLVAKLWH